VVVTLQVNVAHVIVRAPHHKAAQRVGIKTATEIEKFQV